jgi:hypothetical protein
MEALFQKVCRNPYYEEKSTRLNSAVNIGGETQNIVFQESLVSNSFGTPSTS